MSVCHGCGAELTPPALKWCSERCRKASYGHQLCVDCGAPTCYGPRNGIHPEPRCRPCSDDFKTIWTRDAIVCAIQDWASVYGEHPGMADWNPWSSRHTLHDEERALRYEAEPGRWPNFMSVVRAFGSWNAAMVAAGFEPRVAHGGDGNHLRHRKAAA